MLSVSDTKLWLSAVVETEVTVGAVVSAVVELSVAVDSSRSASFFYCKSRYPNKNIILEL